MPAKMRRQNTYITEAQHQLLAERARDGRTIADLIRYAIDRYLAHTAYIAESIDLAAKVHPEMTYENFLMWLLFRWRIEYEGKDRASGQAQIIAMLEEILRILRNDQGADHG